MKYTLIALAGAALTACSPPAAQAPPAAPIVTDAPAGAYQVDPAHASLLFRVNHIGFSMYTARFTRFDAVLSFDPANPAQARIEATIDPRTLELPSPPPGFADELLGPNWLDAARFPAIIFRSNGVVLTGATSARIIGDLTLHGITKPVTLEATFNGGYAGHELEPRARIGFSVRGSFKRSDFGIGYGIPAPGSNMGVGDEVEVVIEAEFTGPAWTGAAP